MSIDAAKNSAALLPADADRAIVSLQRGGLLNDHLNRLAALPAHGNRKLRIDQLVLGLLLAFFEPLARSLRTIEDQGDFAGRLDLPRLARSTTSDALAALDPASLLPLIQDLRQRVPQLPAADADLPAITRRIIAGDGTYLTTLADVAWALRHRKSDGKTQAQIRANLQLDVASFTPQVISISGDDGSEPAAFAGDLLRGVLYVLDRNFLDFDFLKQLLDRDNDFVLRVRSNAPAATTLMTLVPTAADAEAGVIADEIVTLCGKNAPPGRFRRVTLRTTNRHGQPETIILLSNLTDSDNVSARVIAAIYRQRWQIELFFKWLKTWARMDHLFSTSKNGITFQFYVAMIAVLMMYLASGRRVSVYALAAMSRLARGQCTLQEAMAIIAKRERERELNRDRQARHRARKKLA